MIAQLQAVAAYAGALRVSRMSRPRFEDWQAQRLNHWLENNLRQVAFYGTARPELSALPVIDKALVMARFEEFNVGRISATAGWQALSRDGRINEISIGASTGTSGNLMLYAITPGERYRWLGTMLAKALPGFFLRSERVAVILPQDSSLYAGANHVARMRLRFFDLREGSEKWGEDLATFAPTTIIAPPRVLRHLAETGPVLVPRRLFAAAETLDSVDRAVIETHFARPLGQIYMATEGLFGVSCSCGSLHLAEDTNYFEFEPIGDGLVSPVVTGFRRSFQVMARYRINDLLRLSHQPCACGSPLRVIHDVVGRMDDAFAFGSILVTPDVMRNAVLNAARAITDFRIRRDGPLTVTLVLKPDLGQSDAEAACRALNEVFAKRGVAVEVVLRRAPMMLDKDRKLRRVENIWRAKE